MTTAADSTAPDAESLPNFRRYSAVYDLLYRDKDYAGEADYVARTLRAAAPTARSILELGSGTGRHGRLLAARGFDVYGIERSPDMVALARSTVSDAPELPHGAGSFACEVGDARLIELGRHFDAVIALFHVVSYQTTDDDLQAIFAGAARHLSGGGVFLFDIWHGPAVEAQKPESRVKRVSDQGWEVLRSARPEIDNTRHIVRVTYDIECRDLRSAGIARFSEDHLVRYLFPLEIDALAAHCDMEIMASEEFVTGAKPSPATWGVMYLLRKVTPR